MQQRLPLLVPSPPGWIKSVLNNFDYFLQDHADCERKASAFAMSLVAKYPNRTEIIPGLIETALEELEHFRDVYNVLESRGLQLLHEIKEDTYIKKLLACCRTGRDEHFMDRLILGSIIENRGAERFRLVYENLPEGELKKFYHRLWASEGKHGEIFVRWALIYFTDNHVFMRYEELNALEAEILRSLPFTGRLH